MNLKFNFFSWILFLRYSLAISIDGQLTVIRNDCYERLAIGQKLSPKQTYKTYELNTVSKCEKECTREKESCRTYSFGIGPKGNASCLLGNNPIKETADLKPIGTISDTDYDLYIKKLDCHLVLEPQNQEHSAKKPTNQHYHQNLDYPKFPETQYQHNQQYEEGHLAQENYHHQTENQHDGNFGNLPAQSNYHGTVANFNPETGYHYEKPSSSNTHANNEKLHHVQTLVSIASGPNTMLHPVHDILVSGDPYGNSNKPMENDDKYKLPPFRPPALNYLYDDHKPLNRPQQYPKGNNPHYPVDQGSHLEYPEYGYGSYDHQLQIDRRKYDSFSQQHASSASDLEVHRFDPHYNIYDRYERPNAIYPSRYGSVIPHPDDYNRPNNNNNDYLFVRPNRDPEYYRPNEEYNRPVARPATYPTRRPEAASTSLPNQLSTELTNHYGGVDYIKKPGNNLQIISENSGYNGKKITSIITELRDACFRRTMAGKRAVRGLVRKLSICDTIEQCQQECGEERRFTCEGFNYRLDPSGRGKGECELLDLPLSHIDIAREIVTDPDYDFYTRDRNAAQVNCRQPPSEIGGHRFGYEDRFDESRRGEGIRPFDRRPTDIARPLRRPGDRWENNYGDPPRPRPPPINQRPLEYGNRRGDYSFHHSHESHSSHSHSYHYNEHNVDRYDYRQQQEQNEDRQPYKGIHYLPVSPSKRPLYGSDRYIPPKRYPVIIPLDVNVPRAPLPSKYPLENEYGDTFRPQNNYYIPSAPHKPDIPKDWGLYGGTYGTGNVLEYQGYGNRHNFNYWGFNKFEDDRKQVALLPPNPHRDNSYLPLPRPSSGGYSPFIGHEIDNAILPLEPRRPPNYNFIRDECSLRSATGFRLHKGIVKRLFLVPNIYECELLCVKEKDFPCASYAFRYTSSDLPADNCYLSDRNYKELDYYTDLEPDRDYDIYTMNNKHKCQEPNVFVGRDDSDCFWRVRSGQRLDYPVVRDSLTVKSIVDCQLECLQSHRFTCRAYSFRYGSPIIGGAIDNCLLTDWPYHELDPRKHFVPEPGFEVYERGSYGHGCEPNPFGIRGNDLIKDSASKADQLCYVGFGSAAKLLPQATVKSLNVPTELDCKAECSKLRENALLKCMTFSFVTSSRDIDHNCLLTDILQRDLLPNVDYVEDPNSWLFTWNNYNPNCIDLALHQDHLHENGVSQMRGIDYSNALDVWKVYSVSGWPCKRGTLCKENAEAGFWYCELEGGLEKNAWDYCCSPDHHCGLSNGYPYSWCYVGPSRTQWRKCNDQYYPYIHNELDRFDNDKRPWHTSGYNPPHPQVPGFRPDRPSAPPRPRPPGLTLDEYEQEFDNAFLSPPRPGGFGQPRRWPVAYLHKEMPPNAVNSSDFKTARTVENAKLSAIKSLIDVIQNTEIRDVQYSISNDSSAKSDDVLFVKIPLPNLDELEENKTNHTKVNNQNELKSKTKVNFQVPEGSRMSKSLPIVVSNKSRADTFTQRLTAKVSSDNREKVPIYRKGFVTRTNITNRGTE